MFYSTGKDLVNQLKKLLESKKNQKIEPTNGKQMKPAERTVIIATKTDRFGNEIPLTRTDLESDDKAQSNRKQKKVRLSDLIRYSPIFLL
jgi:hypothetical protein